jgi:hypothetical protein
MCPSKRALTRIVRALAISFVQHITHDGAASPAIHHSRRSHFPRFGGHFIIMLLSPKSQSREACLCRSLVPAYAPGIPHARKPEHFLSCTMQQPLRHPALYGYALPVVIPLALHLAQPEAGPTRSYQSTRTRLQRALLHVPMSPFITVAPRPAVEVASSSGRPSVCQLPNTLSASSKVYSP